MKRPALKKYRDEGNEGREMHGFTCNLGYEDRAPNKVYEGNAWQKAYAGKAGHEFHASVVDAGHTVQEGQQLLRRRSGMMTW